MKKNFGKRAWFGGMLALAMVCGVSHAVNELGPNGEVVGGDSADESNRYLGNVYKDEVAGIVIAPPVGARVIARAGLELMSFVNDEKQWGGSVQSLTLKDKMSVKQYKQQSLDDLTKTFKGVQVVDSKEMKFQNFEAGRLTTTLETEIAGPGGKGPKEKLAVYRQDLIVQTGESQFMLLTMYTPLKDRAEAEKTFDAMVKSFRILDKDEIGRKRLAASAVGKKWLAQRSADELSTKLIQGPQMFRIKLGGANGKPASDVGYVRFDEFDTKQLKKDSPESPLIPKEGSGVVVVVSTRTWPADGAVLGENTAFWRYSHDEKAMPQSYSTWENATKYLKKGANLPGGQYEFWFKETGMLMEEGNTRLDAATLSALQREREDLLKRKDIPADQIPPSIEPVQKTNHIVVVCTGDPTQGFTESSKGLDAMIPEYRPAVLPKVLEYVWPRLVDLNKPSEMMFLVYSSASRKLTYRTLSVVGPAVMTLDGKRVNCVQCQDDMDNAGTTMWVDSSGKILKMLTSDQSELVPTTQDEMLRVWGAKLQAK